MNVHHHVWLMVCVDVSNIKLKEIFSIINSPLDERLIFFKNSLHYIYVKLYSFVAVIFMWNGCWMDDVIVLVHVLFGWHLIVVGFDWIDKKASEESTGIFIIIINVDFWLSKWRKGEEMCSIVILILFQMRLWHYFFNI